MNITDIKQNLNKYIGKKVSIKYNLGRNKYEKYNVVIKELFDNVFLVEKKETHEIESFSYNDVITKIIKIDYNE